MALPPLFLAPQQPLQPQQLQQLQQEHLLMARPGRSKSMSDGVSRVGSSSLALRRGSPTLASLSLNASPASPTMPMEDLRPDVCSREIRDTLFDIGAQRQRHSSSGSIGSSCAAMDDLWLQQELQALESDPFFASP
jgi:hypothetical protein